MNIGGLFILDGHVTSDIRRRICLSYREYIAQVWFRAELIVRRQISLYECLFITEILYILDRATWLK